MNKILNLFSTVTKKEGKTMKRTLVFVLILLLTVPSLAYADTKTDSKSLLDRVFDVSYGNVFEGWLETSLTYSKVTSPSGSIKKGTSFPVSGTLKLQSLAGNAGEILTIRFNISQAGWFGKNIVNRTYNINKKQVSLGDYSAVIAQDIASLPTGDYKYSLSVTYKGKLLTETETVASTSFSISDDGKSYEKPEISISGSSGTSAMTAGTGFALTGKIKTSHGKLTQVVVKINGQTVRTFTPNSATFDLGANVGTLEETKQLDGGSHYYSVVATAENGYHKVEETVIGQRVDVSGTLPKKQYKISISSVSAPSSLKKGSNYGLRGVITVENGTLTSVKGQVISESGKVVLSGSHSLNTSSHDIRNSINNDLTFGKLSAGTYNYVLTATVKTEQGETVQEVLVQKTFTVYSETTKPAEDEDDDYCEDQEVDDDFEDEEDTAATWGSWSEWSTTKVTATATRQVETKTETVTKTTYTYKHWHYTHKKNGAQNSYAEYKGSQYVEGSGKWEYYTTSEPLKQTDTKDGYARYKVNGVSWYHETKKETTEEITYYRYRELQK